MATASGACAQSLEALYVAARAYDPVFLSARAQAESVPFRAAQADALMRPNVALTSGASRTLSDRPAGNPDLTTNAIGFGFTARQPLFNRANALTIDQAHKLVESSQADLDAAEQELIIRVARAYFDVLAAQDVLATTRSSKAAIAEQLAAAKRNFEVGTATITDTREAQARSDLADAQEIAAQNDLQTRQIALDLLVGRAQVSPWHLKTPVTLPNDLLGPDVATWVLQAEASHPDVRRAAYALDIAQLESEKARAGHLPTLDLVGSIGPNRLTGNGASYSSSGPGTTTNKSVGVQLNLPLYTGGSVQNRLRETLALEEKSRQDLQGALRAVSQATRLAYATLASGRAQVSALEAAEASSQLALQATQVGYRVGVRVNIDVLNAQSQLYATQRDLAKARYDVLVGSLQLRQAAGQLRAQDVAMIERLLVPAPVAPSPSPAR